MGLSVSKSSSSHHRTVPSPHSLMPSHLLTNPPPPFQIALHLKAVQITWSAAQRTPAELQQQAMRIQRVGLFILVAGMVLWNLMAAQVDLSSHPMSVVFLMLMVLGWVVPPWLTPRLMTLRRSLTQRLMPASLTLHPARLELTWRRRTTTVLLEDIASVTGTDSVDLVLNDGSVQSLPGTGQPSREALFWLQNVVSEAVREHRARLAEAGHDLSEPAKIPHALQQTLTSKR